MTPPGKNDLSRLIKEKAADLGFDLCGIAPARKLREYEKILKNWIAEGMNGDMDFITRSFEKRINPSLLLDGAKSIVVVGLNYFTAKKQGGNGVPVISRYAYGIDYHYLIKEKLSQLLDFIIAFSLDAKGQPFVDGAPVIEKVWAREAGIGWFGKNSLILNKEFGSFIFLGVLILNIELDRFIYFLRSTDIEYRT
jgi:epoxyqueuosine reductase